MVINEYGQFSIATICTPIALREGVYFTLRARQGDFIQRCCVAPGLHPGAGTEMHPIGEGQEFQGYTAIQRLSPVIC